MDIRIWILIFFLLKAIPGLYGQNLSLNPVSAQPLVSEFMGLSLSVFPADTLVNSDPDFSIRKDQVSGIPRLSHHFIPEYARENPSGYSFLCRMELSIENELPVGVWMKVGDAGGITHHTGNNLHFRLKLLRF